MERQNRTAVLTSCLADGGIPFVMGEPLDKHTSFRIGGPAAVAVFPENADQTVSAIRACRWADVPYLILGAGSNVLAPDNGFAGCVIFMTGLRELTIEGTMIRAGAGNSLTHLACAARDAGLSGLAFAYGIPGTLGGGVYMNAGAYGGELADLITSVDFYDADKDCTIEIPREDCAFGYRTSAFQSRNGVILGASMTLSGGDIAAVTAEMNDYKARRQEKQPLDYPSAGSAFKRYPGFFTAQLIDEAGLKGYTVGGAQVSEKHAGFIINRGGATAEDVRTLIRIIQEKIREKHGFTIEPEIRMLSDEPEQKENGV